MNSTVKTSGRFSKSRGLRASVPSFSLPHPSPYIILLLPHFLCSPNAHKLLRAAPRGTGTLAMQAKGKSLEPVTCTELAGVCLMCNQQVMRARVQAMPTRVRAIQASSASKYCKNNWRTTEISYHCMMNVQQTSNGRCHVCF